MDKKEKNIVVLSDWMNELHREMISKTASRFGFSCSFFKDEPEAEKAGALSGAEIIFGNAMKTAASSMSLKWLCVSAAGVEPYLKPGALLRDDLILTNLSGAFGVSLAEHMVMQTLMLVRRMPEFQEGIRKKEWPEQRDQVSVKNSRITVLGTGDIGSNYARRIRSFEPKQIIGVNRSGKSTEPAFDQVVSQDQLDLVLPDTDILALGLPSTPETIGILSSDRIALLPNTSYIINVGRGDAIDEDALSKALNEGRLAGAALDVMKHEPLPENDPLWETKNIILTPHVAGNMTIPYTKNRAVEMFCEDLENYAFQRPLKYLVDKELGY